MRTNDASPFALTYFRFLQNSQSFVDLDYAILNPKQRALLNLIALAWCEDSLMTVSQIMAQKSFGSPSALYMRLNSLQKMGFLKTISAEEDCRAKYYVPTQKAIQNFEALGEAIGGGFISQAQDLPVSDVCTSLLFAKISAEHGLNTV